MARRAGSLRGRARIGVVVTTAPPVVAAAGTVPDALARAAWLTPDLEALVTVRDILAAEMPEETLHGALARSGPPKIDWAA